MSDFAPLNETYSVETIKHRSVRGGAATLVAQVFRFVLQLGSQIILARLLDPAQFGLIAMAAPVLGFVQTVNDLGLGQAVVQHSEISRPQISALFWLSCALSLCLTLVVILSAPLFAWLYGEPEITPIIRLLGTMIMVAGLAIIPQAILNRRMLFVQLAFIDTACVVVGTAVGVAAAVTGFGYWSLVIAQIATSATTLVLTWAFAGWWPSRPARAVGVGRLLNFGSYLTGANLATYFSVSTDNVLVGAIAGKVALGLYDRSYRLVVPTLGQLMAPISRVAVPMLSRLQNSGDQFARAYVHMLQLTLLVATPGLLVNVFLAKSIIVVFFGETWKTAAPIFAWICLGGFASSTYASTAWLFTSQGRTREQMQVNVAASLINVASFVIGVRWGAVGVASVSAVSFVFIQTPLLVWSATREGAVSAALLVRAIVPFFIAGIASAIALCLLTQVGGSASLATIVVNEIVAYAVFAVALACLPAGMTFIRGTWNLRTSLRRSL